MKVKPNLGMPQYSGRYGDLVFCYNRILGVTYTRRNTYPTLTENNFKMGSITKNLFAIQPSSGFKQDASLYLLRYNSLPQNARQYINNWSQLYLKLMHKMAHEDPTLDLRTITREYIYEHDLPCISIRKAVEAGLLPKVLDWQTYDHQI